jgi:DNA invertase Pin-like site-specific DNA recombinase
MGENIGYIRVSTTEQNIERQLVAFEPYNISPDNVFIDKLSGKDRNRPSLETMIKYCRKGDTVYVKSFDRLGRSMIDIAQIIRDINAKGAIVHVIDGGYSYSGDDSPMSILLMGIMSSVAEFERRIIRERSLEGIATAKLIPGKYLGRKPKFNSEREMELVNRLLTGESATALSREFGISRASVYKIRDRITK